MIKINNTDISDIKINDTSVSKVMLAGDIVWSADSHEHIEIGGIKWATMNIGAQSITDPGLYFQWGDTQGYTADQVGTDKEFKLDSYKWYEDNAISKYNNTDALTTLQSNDDAVTMAWGGNWRMPTSSEWQSLKDAVNITWASDYQNSGIAGFVLTDKTDSSKMLFFPAAGYCTNSSINTVGKRVYCWSSNLNPSDSKLLAKGMCLTSNNLYGNNYYRYNGCSVRGILDE